MKVDIHPWERDEYVIVADGKPLGPTLHKRDARVVAAWFSSAITDIVDALRKLTREEVESSPHS